MIREKEADELYQRLASAQRDYLASLPTIQRAADISSAARAAYDNVLWEVEVHKAKDASGLQRTGCAVVDITGELHAKRAGLAVVAVGYDWGRIAWDGEKYTCRVDVLLADMTQFDLRLQSPTLEGVLVQAAGVLRRGIQDLTTLLSDVTDAAEKLT
jgi:hypothetical protein